MPSITTAELDHSEFPLARRSLRQILVDNDVARGDAAALVHGDRTVTHRELHRRALSLAAGLRGLGLSPGDRVALMARNSPELVELFFAAALSGTVLVPLNYRLAEAELRLILEDVAPSVLALGEGFEHVAELAARLATVPPVVIGLPDSAPVELARSYDSLVTDAPPPETAFAPENDSLLVLMYTGGTTGVPKGVMLSHHGILCTVGLELDGFGFRNETMLAAMPLFHIGILHALSTLACGGRVILHDRVDIAAIAETIERDRVTMTVLLPVSVGELLAHQAARPRNLSSLRYLLYGAAPMSPQVAQRASDAFGDILFGVYGLTESGGVISVLPGPDHTTDRPGEVAPKLASVGRALPGVRIECRTAEGCRAAAGEEGEIVVASESTMIGYWQRPDLTAEAVRDGYLLTGDIGTIDADGYLYLCDRKSSMIITGGENVYPREVEDLLTAHPLIIEAGVVGVPDERWGELVMAYVVSADEGLTEEAVIAHCRGPLTGYKRPKAVRFVDALPRTAVGKIDKRALRSL